MNHLNTCFKFYLTTSVLLLCVQLSAAQNVDSSFKTIYQLIIQKDFFTARDRYATNKTAFKETYQKKIIAAVLANAFNKPRDSNKEIASLKMNKNELPDTLLLKVLRIQEDNFVKLKDYAGAKRTAENVLLRFDRLLTADDKEDLKNNLKIWSALAHVPAQVVSITGDSRLKMTKDAAGLKNLKITVNGHTAQFIFDTGANLSTVSESTAKRLNMAIIPASIDVDAITGISIKADLAVCKALKFGHITVSDAVFLVFPDSALRIPQINYQINGIIGFPIIEALHEIQLTQDDLFIVPQKETVSSQTSNLAIDGLSPLLSIEGKHYAFDTGAEKTILYEPFYKTYKREIERIYNPKTIAMGGAGGRIEHEGFIIDHTFIIGHKSIFLENISVLKSKIKDETVYGNIGQDIIHQFSKMIINFSRMYIRFD